MHFRCTANASSDTNRGKRFAQDICAGKGILIRWPPSFLLLRLRNRCRHQYVAPILAHVGDSISKAAILAQKNNAYRVGNAQQKYTPGLSIRRVGHLLIWNRYKCGLWETAICLKIQGFPAAIQRYSRRYYLLPVTEWPMLTSNIYS